MARSRVAEVLGDAAEILEPMPVDELVGLHYERPFDWLPAEGDGWRVVAAEFVTADDGSGIVHLAPAFGEIDREVAAAEDLPMLNPVNGAARFTDAAAPVQGQFVKDADAELIDVLRASGRLVVVEPYLHSYPHCWRCGTPLIYWAKPTWFAAHVGGEGRDAARERGHQLAPRAHQARSLRGLAGEQRRLGPVPGPVLGHADPRLEMSRLRARHLRRIGRRALRARRASPSPTWTCTGPTSTTSSSRAPACDGGRAWRVEPVLDAWFDSGSMPTASLHYPFENAEQLEAPLPGRLHLRGDRPDPRLVLLVARGEHARLRPHAVPQRRLPRAAPGPGRPEDVEEPRQRHGSVDACCRTGVPTRCAGTSCPRARHGCRSGSRSRASTRRPIGSC